MRHVLLLTLLITIQCLTACTSTGPVAAGADQEHLTLVASHADAPLVLDGRLDEPVWKAAKAYPLQLFKKERVPNYPLNEAGVIRLAWDEKHLYVAGQFEDADVVDTAPHNHDLLYKYSDTMEIFLKPAARHWYWEFYATPRGRRATLFYPSRGRYGMSPMPFDPASGIQVAGSHDGSVNDWNGRDQGFTIEVAIPLAELARDGQRPAPGGPGWRILVTRYNYSAFHDSFQAELSATTTLNAPNFHVFESWSELKLEP